MPDQLAIAGYFRQNQLVGGVASVFHNLLRGIEACVEDIPRYRDLAVTVFHGAAGAPYVTDRFDYRRQEMSLGRFAAEARLGAVDSAGYDATLFPNYSTPPIVRSGRSVTIIHDLFYAHAPAAIESWKKAWLRAAHRKTLRRADVVVTISQAVKDELLREHGSKWVDRVRPIWNPISLDRFAGKEKQSFTDGRPYLLSVGIDRPSKNLATLIRAFDRIKDRMPDHLLVLAGEVRAQRPGRRQHHADTTRRAPPTVDLVRDLGLGDRVKITGYISDAQLGALYRDADLFVFPSTFEGFGMPAIEALASGTPTLTTALPVLREITMGHARCLDDPYDDAVMAEAIVEMVGQGTAGRPSAETVETMQRSFSPRVVAEQYLSALLGD